MKKGFFFTALILSQLATSQLLRTEGKKIVNDKGENIQLRGLGLGGWMVQEGYMLKTADL